MQQIKFFKPITFLLISAFLFPGISAVAQKIKGYKIEYSRYDMYPFGNGPLLITPLLKNPIEYLNSVNNFQYTGFFNSLEIQKLNNYSVDVEIILGKKNSRFWKNNTLLIGLLLSNQLAKNEMALEKTEFIDTNPNNIIYRKTYFYVEQYLQFLGIKAGLRRTHRITNDLSFNWGFFVAANFSIKHYYKNFIDSTKSINGGAFTSTVINQPNLQGNAIHFFHFLLPVNAEFNIYKQKLFFTGGFTFGLMKNNYYTSQKLEEAHGFSMGIIYRRF